MPRDGARLLGLAPLLHGEWTPGRHQITSLLSFLPPPLPGTGGRLSLGQVLVIILSILDARGKRHSSLEADGSDLTLC